MFFFKCAKYLTAFHSFCLQNIKIMLILALNSLDFYVPHLETPQLKLPYPKLCEKSFGCGETFVFTLTADPKDNSGPRKTFKWNGDPKKNTFIACSTDCFSVGIGKSNF